jgi:hypothetical protein
MELVDPYAASILSKAVPEIRITLPLQDNPPFAFTVFIVMESAIGFDENEYRALNAALEYLDSGFRSALSSPDVMLQDVTVATVEELSVAQYRRTAPIYRENLTYQGQEGTTGAVPITSL